jgi:hypothetical protein
MLEGKQMKNEAKKSQQEERERGCRRCLLTLTLSAASWPPRRLVLCSTTAAASEQMELSQNSILHHTETDGGTFALYSVVHKQFTNF